MTNAAHILERLGIKDTGSSTLIAGGGAQAAVRLHSRVQSLRHRRPCGGLLRWERRPTSLNNLHNPRQSLGKKFHLGALPMPPPSLYIRSESPIRVERGLLENPRGWLRIALLVSSVIFSESAQWLISDQSIDL